MATTYIVGDVLRGIAALPDDSVGVMITSPPYWGRRSYTDDPAEIGTGSLALYRAQIVALFEALRPKLRRDAVLWLNLGDTASGSGGAGGDYNKGGKKEGARKYKQGESGLPKGTWCDVPGRVLHDLMDAGWLCRSQIVWDKGQVRPEDVNHVRRPLEQHEMIYLLTQSMSYDFAAAYLVDKGDVWRFAPARGSHGHAAPFPLELPLRCLAVSPAPGLVLDPFVGSGTTLQAAASIGRDSVGIDFDLEASQQARARLASYPDFRITAPDDPTLHARLAEGIPGVPGLPFDQPDQENVS